MNVWVLNLDAEDELALGGRSHTPSKEMEARIRSLLPLLAPLIGDAAMLFPTSHSLPTDAEKGFAWCPTPWAIKRFAEAGLEPPRAPSFEVLRAVNSRRFNAELGQTLPGARFGTEVPPHGTWLLKRPFGYAGRGRRRVHGSKLTPEDLAFIAASNEGLQIEPLVDRVADFALHGMLHEDGAFQLGLPTVQVLDAYGAWQSSRLADDDELRADERDSLFTEATRAARALHTAGYFGPFNLDAFRWRDAHGALHFQPRSEINARYSMGWATGMEAAP